MPIYIEYYVLYNECYVIWLYILTCGIIQKNTLLFIYLFIISLTLYYI